MSAFGTAAVVVSAIAKLADARIGEPGRVLFDSLWFLPRRTSRARSGSGKGSTVIARGHSAPHKTAIAIGDEMRRVQTSPVPERPRCVECCQWPDVQLCRFIAFHHVKLYSGGGRTGRRNVHRTQQQVLEVECK